MSQSEIVSYLKEHEEATIKELADYFNIGVSSIGAKLLRLLKKGIVKRRLIPTKQGIGKYAYSLKQTTN